MLPATHKTKCTQSKTINPRATATRRHRASHLRRKPQLYTRQNSKQIIITHPASLALCLRSQSLHTSHPPRPHGRRHNYFATPSTKSIIRYYSTVRSLELLHLHSAALTIELICKRFNGKAHSFSAATTSRHPRQTCNL